MIKFRFTLTALAIMSFTLIAFSSAQAQATRTWVSGVGDDANPCSRTAPCKTFAGAISKTAKDGEISVLDPGGFGAITITKSITINGTHGAGYGSILTSAGNAVVINITDVNDVRKSVRLVSLNVNGISLAVDGIKVLAATAVSIEDCVVDGFTGSGIQDVRTTTGKLSVLDTSVRNTAQAGVRVVPGVGGAVTAMLDNVQSIGSTANGGYAQSGNVKGTVRNCFFVGNSTNGVFADGTGGELTIENCNISHNGVGIFVGSPAVVRLTNSTLIKNTTSITGGAQVSSTGTNTITGNGTNNLPTGAGITQS